MDPNKEIDNLGEAADTYEIDETISVDDFIKELEAKEKDLHITADTSIIEIAGAFEDGDLPEMLLPVIELERNGTAAKPAASPEPGADAAKLELKVSNLEKKNSELLSKVRELEAERVEIHKDTQRRAKDFENFKSRTEREREETLQSQIGNLATHMLPALDNLSRALAFSAEVPESQREGIQPFFDGIELVNQQVNDVLAGMGIVPIATVGKKFDPHYHEAVAAEPSGQYPANFISGEILRGYRIGDRVVRHSMVTVSTGSGNRATDELEIAYAKAAESEIEADAEITAETHAEVSPETFETEIERFGGDTGEE